MVGAEQESRQPAAKVRELNGLNFRPAASVLPHSQRRAQCNWVSRADEWDLQRAPRSRLRPVAGTISKMPDPNARASWGHASRVGRRRVANHSPKTTSWSRAPSFPIGRGLTGHSPGVLLARSTSGASSDIFSSRCEDAQVPENESRAARCVRAGRIDTKWASNGLWEDDFEPFWGCLAR